MAADEATAPKNQMMLLHLPTGEDAWQMGQCLRQASGTAGLRQHPRRASEAVVTQPI